MQDLHDDKPQFILCKYPPHTDTVCDDQPSSSTTGHDFAKNSRTEHTLHGLFIADINHLSIPKWEVDEVGIDKYIFLKM